MPRAKTVYGRQYAAAHVAYAFTDVAAIYPITPSSPMADTVDQWSAAGLKNIFGNQVKVVEMESEAGAAGAVHGSLGTGAITTYPASQGPAADDPPTCIRSQRAAALRVRCFCRTVATQSLNIFGDHSDVMACSSDRLRYAGREQPAEVMDLSPSWLICLPSRFKVPS